jgi:hypothetical protein
VVSNVPWTAWEAPSAGAAPPRAQPIAAPTPSNGLELKSLVFSARERCALKKLRKLSTALAIGLFFAGAASADTLELKDGRVLQGRFLGGTQAVMRFESNGEVRTFSVNDIVALTFTNNYRQQDSAPPPPPQQDANSGPAQNNSAPPDNPPPPPDNGAAPPPDNSAPPPDAPPPPAPNPPRPSYSSSTNYSNNGPTQLAPGAPIAVPVGQTLLVRMIDGVDSKKNNVGDVFHASLETDLTVNGYLVARKGSDVYGKLAYAKEAGHFSGSAELELQLTRIVVGGTDYPLVSDDYTLKGKGRGGDTAKKVGGGAIIGAIIGGIAGGGAGAAIGAGAGGAVGAGVQVFTRGKEVKVPSETLLEFKLQAPATVNATSN